MGARVMEEFEVVRQPLLFRPEEAAERLSVSRTMVFELIRSGRLRSVKIGGARRISSQALADFVAELEREWVA
jgi:excisionase family DNA binding protein